MQSFTYIIKDELGVHARPAGLIVDEAKKYSATLTMTCDGKRANAARLMAIMAMGIKYGREVTVIAEGDDEAAAIEGMKQLFEANL